MSKDNQAHAAKLAASSAASGLDIGWWASLISRYGTEFADLVQRLIDEFAARPTPVYKSGGDACDPAVAKALCDQQHDLIHALCANHCLCHALGCCPDHEH